ncbi:Uncharacterised protein [Candidatus Ornithobacterium hominis]|uniref:Uncharacterized protein n=1 Tax=Candidatus Ornithobacterium hominis TaxID=2497989 RepID=A0A383U4F2_9FLAO|nr:hypothetical protein [Candidatus Ornithobacterium hominis]MCT7905251.1 hypothetical protein [Candidatus Ornithobacterium hominis]SZD74348.1 Uncharacterised protein [Candidatus Ornithobacterium hominis]
MRNPLLLQNHKKASDLLLLLNYDSNNRKVLTLEQRILIHKNIQSLKDNKPVTFPSALILKVEKELNIIKTEGYKYTNFKYNNNKELVKVNEDLL